MGGLSDFLTRTMVIERLFGVSTYAIVLWFFYSKIKNTNSDRNVSRYLNWYIVVLAIMAFFVIPEPSADLYRWRVMGDYWQKYSFSQIFELEILKSGTPISYIYIYLFQKTGINGLLPAFCAVIFYSCIFYIIKHSKTYFELSNRDVAIVLMIVMSLGKFFEVISGVRSMVAISIVAMFIFREFVERKSFLSALPFYIVASLIHNMALVMVMLRMIMFVFEKDNRPFRKILNAIIILLFALAFYRYGGQYITIAFKKANSYLNNEEYSYIWEWIMAGFMYLNIVWLQIRMRTTINSYNANIFNIYRFSCVLSIIALFVSYQYSMFHRLVTFNTFMMIPIWGIAFQAGRENGNFSLQKQWKIIALMLVVFACLRGDLCGYKFFKL